jgi:hypothetical protein
MASKPLGDEMQPVLEAVVRETAAVEGAEATHDKAWRGGAYRIGLNCTTLAAMMTEVEGLVCILRYQAHLAGGGAWGGVKDWIGRG